MEAQGALNMVLAADGTKINTTVVGAASGATSTGFEENSIWDMVCDPATRTLRVVIV